MRITKMLLIVFVFDVFVVMHPVDIFADSTTVLGDITTSTLTVIGPVSMSSATISSATITALNISTITAVSSATITNLSVSGPVFMSSVTITSATVRNLKDGRTTGSACDGCIGEYVSANWTAATTAASGVWYDAASISLTAGDWDVTALAYSGRAASSTMSDMEVGISTTSGNSNSGLTLGDNRSIVTIAVADIGSGSTQCHASVPAYRMSFSSTTTVYAKHRHTYSGSGPNTQGRISARRL